MKRCSVFAQLLLAAFLHEIQATIIQHKQLKQDLLSNYGERHSRPVKNYNSSVHVYFRAKPFYFVDFEEERQLLTFTSRTQTSWTDELLTWNPDDYGGVDKLSFSKGQIWFPDITTYERIGTGPTTTNVNEPLIVVNHLGQAVYYEILQLTVFCKMNVRLFPFDSHECTQRYTSYTYDGKEVDRKPIEIPCINLSKNISTCMTIHDNIKKSIEAVAWPDNGVWGFDKNMEASHFERLRLHPKLDSSAAEYVAVQNGVWFLKNFKVKEIVEYYLCCPNPYVEIHVTLFIQRESSFYMFNIGIPTLFLSLITLSVFFLHPESGERISLSVSNVLALVIFQQLLAASMPPTGDHTPIIAYFFAVIISISFASVIATTATVRLYFNKGTKPLPKVVRRLLRGKTTRPRRAKKLDIFKGANHTVKQKRRKVDFDDRIYPLEVDADVLSAQTLEFGIVDTSNTMEPTSICTSLTQRHGSFDSTKPVDRPTFADEWKRAAILLDRIMFTISLSVMLMTILYCSYLFVTELGSSHKDR